MKQTNGVLGITLAVILLTASCFEEVEQVPPLPVETSGIFADLTLLFTIETLPDDVLQSPPNLTADAIILHTQNHLTAYTRSAGALLWQTEWQSAGEQAPAPLLMIGQTVAVAGNEQLALFDLATGALRTSIEVDDTIIALGSTADTLMIATASGSIIGAELASGNIVWEFKKPTDQGVEIESYRDFYYVNSSAGVSAADAASGDIRWTTKMWDKGGAIALHPSEEIMYVSAVMPDQTLHILAIDLQNQSMLWDADIPDTDISIDAQLATTPTRLFEASEQLGRLMAIDIASGSTEWLSPSLHGSPSIPLPAGERVFIEDDEMLYAFAAADGAVLGTLAFEAARSAFVPQAAADTRLLLLPVSPQQVQAFSLPE